MENGKEVVEQTTNENTVTDTAEEKVVVTNEEKPREKSSEHEEKPKERMFTQEEMNKISQDRAYRTEQKIREEYERKLSRLQNTLNAGLGTTNLDEATTKLEDFYRGNGIEIPEAPRYTKREEDLLANAEAKDIIDHGYDEISVEINRLSAKGNNMTEREKKIFAKLEEEKRNQESIKELKSIGVDEKILNDAEFKDFASKLNPSLSIKEKYEMYNKFSPKKQVETIGSMKSEDSTDTGLKDFYTREEALSFTREDLDKNPGLVERIEKSMSKWK